jgi:pimeloyl-ACP methyl ester carboxylesterase
VHQHRFDAVKHNTGLPMIDEVMRIRTQMAAEGWWSNDFIGWDDAGGYSILFHRYDWHGRRVQRAGYYAHTPDLARIHEAAQPPCTSASPTPPVRARCWLQGRATAQSPVSASDEAVANAARLEKEGMAAFAETYAQGAIGVQLENKDPRGFAEFKAMLAEHSAKGAANTQLGVQRERPSVFDLEGKLAACRLPMLVVTGDEDWPCLMPNVFIKRTCLTAALLVIPNSGHAVNIEEPAAFNGALADFLAQVDAGRWPTRDPRAVNPWSATTSQ